MVFKSNWIRSILSSVLFVAFIFGIYLMAFSYVKTISVTDRCSNQNPM